MGIFRHIKYTKKSEIKQKFKNIKYEIIIRVMRVKLKKSNEY